MSQRDTADVLKIVPPAIAPETRRFVYVPNASEFTDVMKAAWLAAGWETEFVYEDADPNKVGLVIFQLRHAPYVTPALAEQLRPFYAKAGTESNVFEFDPVVKIFTRRNPDWLEFPGRIR